MDADYNPRTLEAAVQARWQAEDAHLAKEDGPGEPYYCLAMFPYPSGKLHMGHVRNYAIGDAITRFEKMRGRNTMQPMGWDAFGMPAENAAIKNKVPPARWTYDNIAYMRQQLQRMGFAYDWQRELATCRPEYYRWEQWLFLQMLERGLAYRKQAVVNWDPVDQTVLANEQVIDGRGWRSGALVERREIPQWFIKITDYADELLESLDSMTGWPDSVKTQQRNWIGRSRGLEIRFEVPDHTALEVFTTRPDTLFGVSYLAVAPEHPLAQSRAGDPAIAAIIEAARKTQVAEAELATMEKLGAPLGIDAIHPLTGKPVPIWTANFVLMSYGTGAVMAVPGHDQRDYEFANKYHLPILPVIRPLDAEAADLSTAAFTDHGITVNSGAFDGLTFDAAFDAIASKLDAEGKGRATINYRLRDWGVSRQRYWGCPIPVVHCDTCGIVPVPEDQLPVVLPEDVTVTGAGSPLPNIPEFVNTTCPKCGRPARRETDTFDTFMESSWYYARFASANNDAAMLDERADYWCPVNQYIGGVEHAILHLLYARFIHKVMRDIGLMKSDEPFDNLLTQGMVVAETFYRREADGATTYYNPTDVELSRDTKGQVIAARLLDDGQPVEVGGIEKMSKSKNNGVDPQSMVDTYGADTVRVFSLFAAPPDQQLEWSDAGVEGASRFLKRLWRAAAKQHGKASTLQPDALNKAQRALRRKTHETIAKVTDDYARRRTFNTAIAAVMELTNTMAAFNDESDQGRAVMAEAWQHVVMLLAPIAPHLCQALWEQFGHHGLVTHAMWPQADELALHRNELTLVVQVNGKRRSEIVVPADASKDDIEASALADNNVQRFIEGKAIRKVIVVPGRLISIVV